MINYIDCIEQHLLAARIEVLMQPGGCRRRQIR